MSRITFLKVKTNQEKLESITKIVERHFDLAQNILISTPNEQVANYIDQLLWRMTEESFIPHTIATAPCHDAVIITSTAENFNQASVLINLCPGCPPSFNEFTTVYELYDLTHPEKEALSKSRHESYLQSNSKVFMQEAIN